MKTKLFAAAAAAASLIVAGAAHADLLYAHASFVSFDSNPAPDTLVTGFETNPSSSTALADIIYFVPGITVSTLDPTKVKLVTGSVLNVNQAPTITPPSTQDPTQYLSVEAGGDAVITFASAIKSISFYVGSFDSYDLMTFHYVPPTIPTHEVGDGSWVAAETAGFVDPNGNILSSNSNGRLTLTFDVPVWRIDLGATQNAFEISDIALPAPEPTTWAMMITGFGGIGSLMRRRRRQGAAVTA